VHFPQSLLGFDERDGIGMGFLLVKISKELGMNRGLWSCIDISRYDEDEKGKALFFLCLP
jgi:hypothetical protein